MVAIFRWCVSPNKLLLLFIKSLNLIEKIQVNYYLGKSGGYAREVDFISVAIYRIPDTARLNTRQPTWIKTSAQNKSAAPT